MRRSRSLRCGTVSAHRSTQAAAPRAAPMRGTRRDATPHRTAGGHPAGRGRGRRDVGQSAQWASVAMARVAARGVGARLVHQHLRALLLFIQPARRGGGHGGGHQVAQGGKHGATRCGARAAAPPAWLAGEARAGGAPRRPRARARARTRANAGAEAEASLNGSPSRTTLRTTKTTRHFRATLRKRVCAMQTAAAALGAERTAAAASVSCSPCFATLLRRVAKRRSALRLCAAPVEDAGVAAAAQLQLRRRDVLRLSAALAAVLQLECT